MSSLLPLNSWDCHVHCFDPDSFPFRVNRAYTPKPAKLDALLQNVHASRVMIVQATIEDGFHGLLSTLEACRRLSPGKAFRGTVLADEALRTLDKGAFARMHELGVRCIRIHGSHGGSGGSVEWVIEQLKQAAALYPVKEYGWLISAQLPLSTWASLKDFILLSPELSGIMLISDHNGSACPSDRGSAQFRDFLELLKSGKLAVKVGALHRRSPSDILRMEPIIKEFAQSTPSGLLWASDWPHVDASKKGLLPADPVEGVDTEKELQVLRSWLSEESWNALMVKNPDRLFWA